MSSAQLDQQPMMPSALTRETPPSPVALKQQVAERLAAHRARRGYSSAPTSAPTGAGAAARTAPPGRNAAIAGAIAERYARTESYRSFLAAEAERSVRQAQAAAEIATINARAIVNAQHQMLADLEHWDLPAEELSSAKSLPLPLSTPPQAAPSYTVRLAEHLLRPRESSIPLVRDVPDEIDVEECSALDDEILFRHDPTFVEATAITPLSLTANLIEFPRQLVATRKARPRLAEGPLRTGEDADPTQLRIFEVTTAEPSSAEPPPKDAPTPDWSSILLPARPAAAFTSSDAPTFAPTLVPQVAPIHRRLTAALVDAALVLTTLLASGAVFIETVARVTHRVHPLHPSLPVAGSIAATALVALGLLYVLLFFTFGESTPGMRYARIALCTFADENPSRSAMRRRLFSTVLAALPGGVGLLWAFVDEDALGWHDRLSRMYQRCY